MGETGVVEVQASGRVLPAGVELERLHCVAVRKPEEALEHHHHGDDTGRHGPAPVVSEQVSKKLVGEQDMALAVQYGEDRVLLHPSRHEARRALHQVSLARRQPDRHCNDLCQGKHMSVILTGP